MIYFNQGKGLPKTNKQKILNVSRETFKERKEVEYYEKKTYSKGH